MKTKYFKTIVSCTLVLIAVDIKAQIQMVEQPYQEEKKIQFSISATNSTTPINTTATPTIPANVITPTETWRISLSDKTIRETLAKWGRKSGYQVIWEMSKDIPIIAEATFTGNFESVVAQVLETLRNSDYPIEATIYDNNVVRIVKTASIPGKMGSSNE